MSIRWLHVSDFHIHAGSSYDQQVVLRALIESVARFRRQGREPDLLFATGDVAFRGKVAEYESATAFLDALLDAAGLDRSRLFVIPGNHDVDRGMGVGLARTLGSHEEADAYFSPQVPKPHLKQKLGAFIEWYGRYFDGIRQIREDSTCGPVEVVEVKGCRIGVLPLNSALFCQGDDDYGKLIIGRRSLDAAIAELRMQVTDLRVALIHHPLDWLSEVEQTHITAVLQENVDVVLRGHLHDTNVETSASMYDGFVHLAAGATYQTRKWPNRGFFAEFDGKDLTVLPIRYEDQPREIWTVDPSLFPDEPEHSKRFLIPRLAPPAAEPRRIVPVTRSFPPAQSRFRSNIPSRNDFPFVGREELLVDILARLGDPSTERVLVLYGLPGVGKSELAREFARRYRNRYPGGTFFVDASAGAEMVNLARIGANHLGLDFPPHLPLNEQCERTLLSFGSEPVLLIYDNVTLVESVQSWLPPAGIPCHVLITAASERWNFRWPLLEVAPLTRTASMELIERLAGHELLERYGNSLAELAGGLPIQICPAAVMLAYEARRGRLDDSVKLTITHEARESFGLVYEHLEDPVRLLLHAAAFLNRQHIVRQELYWQLKEADGWSEADFHQRLDTCLDLHLLEGGADLRMHQLLASFLRATPLSAENTWALERVRRVQGTRLVELARALVAHPVSSELAGALLGYPLSPEGWDRTLISRW
jgi:predicted phosphodiesterase